MVARRFCTALLTAVVLAGCAIENDSPAPGAGTDRTEPDAPATSSSPSSDSVPPSVASPAPTTDASSPPQRDVASCVLSGKNKATVTLTDIGDALQVVFAGELPSRAGAVLYSVTAFDEAGEVGVQLGMQSEGNGGDLAAFVFDFVTTRQSQVDNSPQAEGDRVVGTFPKTQLGDLADVGVASWSGALNLDGTDIGTCPPGLGALPFPG